MDANTVSESNVVTDAISTVPASEPASAATDISTTAVDAVASIGDAGSAADSLEILNQVSEMSIYLMGGGFILGSLFTIFLLVVLDFMRRNKTDESK